MSNVPCKKTAKAAFAFAYAANLAALLYFAKSLSTLHSSYLLSALLALVGLGLGVGFSFVAGKGEGAGAGKIVLGLIFAAAHGAVAYALAHYGFNLDWRTSLAYPVGALVAWVVFAALACGYSKGFSSLLGAAFMAGGLVIALRLGSVWGGLAFSFGLLNAMIPGGKWLGCESEASFDLARLIFFGALLAAGRAAIQYYLLVSNYAALGVVVTHPYTYVALFAGIFLPALLWVIGRDRLLHPALALVLLGIIFPLALGTFVHVRPMAAFLLGLVTSSFVFGALFPDSYGMGILSYLSLAAATLGLPLFTKVINLSRVARLEVLGVLALVFFLVLAFVIPRGPATPRPQES